PDFQTQLTSCDVVSTFTLCESELMRYFPVHSELPITPVEAATKSKTGLRPRLSAIKIDPRYIHAFTVEQGIMEFCNRVDIGSCFTILSLPEIFKIRFQSDAESKVFAPAR